MITEQVVNTVWYLSKSELKEAAIYVPARLRGEQLTLWEQDVGFPSHVVLGETPYWELKRIISWLELAEKLCLKMKSEKPR